ncbi:MAG: aminoglycoside phosphotransferase family protein [Candidatus Omnitrophica bacterium]|nr:aminoglycoside phosphotransferase family protein [Candidatus Omnitrophota bacterium]
MQDQILAEILSRWNIALGKIRPELLIAGSPERSEYRVVVESADGRLYILEKIALRLRERKTRIARTLESLAGFGLPELHPYLRDVTGEFLSPVSDGLWQVVTFVPGVNLERPQYVHEHWRGQAMADLLIRLRQAAHKLPSVSNETVFSLPHYIDGLMRAVKLNRPDIMPRVQNMYDFARQNLYPVFASLPSGFCHGDYHPVNIIWKERGIAALIDWEFMGMKPELYDAANMVGCLGIEDPECLWSGSAVDFITDLKAAALWSDVSFASFPELVMSLRFAWLSEWLRKEDEEMIGMELDYFDVLNANRDDLARLWQCRR